MNLMLLIDISKSLLMARWRQTLVAAVGVTFSIAMFITLLGFMNGLNDMLDGLILNRTPHVRLFNEIKPNPHQPIRMADSTSRHFIHSIKPTGIGQNIDNALAIMAQLKKDPRVYGVAPKLSAQIFYNSGSINLTGVINGVDAEAEMKLFKFQDYVTTGKAIDLKNIPNSIILGKGVADKMLASVGDVIQVTTPSGERQSLKVIGLYQSGLQDLDKVQSYTAIATAQKLLNKPGSYITDINIKTVDVNTAPIMSKEFHQLFDVEAEDIQTANAQFETGSKVRSIISYAVGITLLIVAGFGIYNILNMMIYEKMDAIAILKATGFSGSDVKSIFLYIALSIGIFGGLFGLLFGFLISNVIDQIPFKTASLPTIKTYPVNYDLRYYMIGLIFSLVTTYFAGFFPARKASKIDPVIIIRGK